MAFWTVRESLTNQERRNKYNQLRDVGYTSSWSSRVRDWSWPHFQMMIDRKASKNPAEPGE